MVSSIWYYPSRFRRYLLVLPLLCFIFSGCDTEYTTIPDCEVYLRRNIINEGFLTAGAYIYVAEPVLERDILGYGGIIVVYTYDPVEPYCAFDLACPNCVSPTIRISEPDDMLVCTCETCGERYDLFYGNGNPLDGISKVYLKKYSAYIDPGNELYIIVTP